MKKYEKFIIIAIVFKFIGIFLASQLPHMLLSTGSVPLIPGQAMQQMLFIAQFIVSYLENGGIAYWLYQESHNGVWTLFGFIFGIPALLLFYLLAFLKKHTIK